MEKLRHYHYCDFQCSITLYGHSTFRCNAEWTTPKLAGAYVATGQMKDFFLNGGFRYFEKMVHLIPKQI